MTPARTHHRRLSTNALKVSAALCTPALYSSALSILLAIASRGRQPSTSERRKALATACARVWTPSLA